MSMRMEDIQVRALTLVKTFEFRMIEIVVSPWIIGVRSSEKNWAHLLNANFRFLTSDTVFLVVDTCRRWNWERIEHTVFSRKLESQLIIFSLRKLVWSPKNTAGSSKSVLVTNKHFSERFQSCGFRLVFEGFTEVIARTWMSFIHILIR